MRKRVKGDRGALTVEATIVYPVSFLVIFLMLYMGNVYFQKARVEGIVSQAMIEGAAMCADPMLSHIEKNGSVPGLEKVDIKPYRYVTAVVGSGMDDIEKEIETKITKQINDLSTGLFMGMKPHITQAVNATYKSVFVASSLSVDLKYRIDFPIRLLGSDDDLSITFGSYFEVPVGDTPEFIRNINMIQDILESTGVADNVKDKTSGMIAKVKELFGEKK